MSGKSLVLGSRSARRAQLLRDAGYAFDQLDPPFADPPHPAATGPASHAVVVAVELARRKAMSVEPMPRDAVLLAADTICVADERMIGQPVDRDEAEAILRRFVGRSHQVVTGVALREGRLVDTLGDVATVVWGDVHEQQLNDYLDSETWRGKAGAYNLFERQAAGWPIEVEGDPATVVGLPMQRLTAHLDEMGIHPRQPSPSRGTGA